MKNAMHPGMQMKLRKMMIEMVLGTDMKQHWTIMSRFQTKLQVKIHTSITTAAATSDDSPFNSNSEADRFLVLQVHTPATLSFQRHCQTHMPVRTVRLMRMPDVPSAAAS